jgi:hypothetical protein
MMMILGFVAAIAGCEGTIKCPDSINVGDPCPPAACVISEVCGCGTDNKWTCGAAELDMATAVPNDMSTPHDLLTPED